MDFYQELIVGPGRKDLASNLAYRVKIRERATRDPGFRNALIQACREDVLYFLNAAAWLHEPRPRRDEKGRRLPSVIPFISWPHQDPVIRTIRDHLGLADVGCLGGDTGVATNRGIVRIKDIRSSDLIWDGHGFVPHGGVVSQGARRVIRAYGLTLTPDHLVLTREGWQRADQGIDRAPVRMPGTRRRNHESCTVQVQVRRREELPRRRGSEGGQARWSPELQHSLSTQDEIVVHTRDEQEGQEVATVFRLGRHGGALRPANASCLPLLRWARHYGRREVAELRQFLGGHEGFVLSGFDPRSDRQQRRVLQGKLPVGQQEGAGEQQTEQPPDRHNPWHDDHISGRRSGRHRRVINAGESCCGLAQRETLGEEEVYDILDCGPNNQFVVIGDAPTVVHNCEKSRGEGMSWIAVWLAIQDWTFRDMVSIGMVSRNMDYADTPGSMKSLGAKIDFGLARLPDWMIGEQDKDWKRSLTNHSWSNLRNGSLITAEAATGEVGSGDRTTYYIMDELSKFPSGLDHKAMVSVQGATDSRLIIGTPYGSQGAYHRVMHEASAMVKLVLEWRQNPMRSKGMYRMIRGRPVAVDPVGNPLIPSYNPPDQATQDLFSRLRKKGFRLDKGDRSPWYDHECDRANATPYTIAQELDRDYGGTLYKLFTDDFFDKAQPEARVPMHRINVTYNDEHKPFVEREPNGLIPGLLNLWTSLDARNRPPDHDYFVGVDVSTGLGGSHTSNSAIEIIDGLTMEQVGELAANTIPPPDLADLCVAICVLFGNAYLAWEKNGPGHMFHARMMQIRYPNVYYRTKLFDTRRKKIREPGWWTDAKSKEVLLGELKRSVVADELKLHSLDLIRECHQYVRVGKQIVCESAGRGRTEGDTDEAHGDRVIAFGVALQALRDRPVNRLLVERAAKIQPGSIEERDLMWERLRVESVDDWDHRTNWDLVEGHSPDSPGVGGRFAEAAWGDGLLE